MNFNKINKTVFSIRTSIAQTMSILLVSPLMLEGTTGSTSLAWPDLYFLQGAYRLQYRRPYCKR